MRASSKPSAVSRAVRLFFWIFALLYLVALVLWVIGTFGWFGQNSGPLAGVFLIPLGMPWVLLLDGVPEAALLWLALLAPLVNLAILGGLAKLVNRN